MSRFVLRAAVLAVALLLPGRALADTVPFPAVLRAYAEVLRGITPEGTATAEYWMRFSTDLALVQNRVGALIDHHDDEVSGLPLATRIALRRRATRLKAVKAEGTGDVHYWVGVAEALVEARNQAVNGLDEIAEDIEEEGEVPASPLAIALHGTAQLVDLIPVIGTGGAEFWLRTCYDQVQHARATADALDDLAADLPEELRELLQEETDAIRALTVSGTGTANYWLLYARQLEEALAVHEEVLLEVAQELAAR